VAETDVPSVVQVAALLQVSEFEVFRLAYWQWFGHAPQELALRAPFQHYLQFATVPPWVRSFVRQVLALQQMGKLDPTEYGIRPAPPANKASVSTGLLAFLGMCLTVTLLVWLIVQLQDAKLAQCLLPPCY